MVVLLTWTCCSVKACGRIFQVLPVFVPLVMFTTANTTALPVLTVYMYICAHHHSRTVIWYSLHNKCHIIGGAHTMNNNRDVWESVWSLAPYSCTFPRNVYVAWCMYLITTIHVWPLWYYNPVASVQHFAAFFVGIVVICHLSRWWHLHYEKLPASKVSVILQWQYVVWVILHVYNSSGACVCCVCVLIVLHDSLVWSHAKPSALVILSLLKCT